MSAGDWTLISLKEHYDQRFTSLERSIDTARHSVERAEDAAATTRLYAEQKSNEFRGQLSDQAGTFMPRAEADQRYATTMQAIDLARINTQKMVDDLRDSNRRGLDELRATTQKASDEVRRLVYIATGIALAAAVAIPLLIQR